MATINHKKYFIVKAIGYFEAKKDDELNLEPRDILQVIKKLDKYWYFGIRNEERGKFPSSKVVEVNVEHELKNSIGIFIALNTFTKKQKGDLGINKNDIIIGTKKIDENWYEGKLLNVPGQGMFPCNFCWKLKENIDDEFNELPPNSVVYATVLHEMEAQLDDELDLKKDEQVIILGEHDKSYYKGELMNGKQGIIPKSFVKIIKNTISTIQPINYSSSSNQQSNHSNLKSNNYSSNNQHYSIENQNYESDNLPSYNEATSWYNNLQTDIPSYGRTLYPFKAENSNEISFEENQIVNLIRYVDENWIEIELNDQIGIAPVNYIDVIVDCSNASNFKSNNESYCAEIEENCCVDDNNVEIEEYPSNTWGKVLFDFKAEMDGDLNLKKDDTIKLTRKFNNDWVEAYNSELDLGICPLNYIKIISQHELSSSFTQQFNKQQSTSHFQNFTPDNLIEFSPGISKNNDLSTENKAPKRPPVLLPPPPSSSRSSFNQQLTEKLKKFNNEPKPIESKLIESKPIESNISKSLDIRSDDLYCKDAFSNDAFSDDKFSNDTDNFNAFSNNDKFSNNTPNDKFSTFNTKSNLYPSTSSFSKTTITTQSNNSDNRLTNRLAKMAEQRICIITELIQTEKDYRYALEICCRTFLKNEKFSLAFQERNADVNSIFSNLEEIIDVSKQLNDRLLNESNKDANTQLIGKCFLDLTQSMSNAYGQYCRNHDDIVATFKRLEQDTEINRFFQRGLDQMRTTTNCFDIPSILIKPVQRLLRYPLLLNELIKCTPNENADYELIQNALRMITDLATNINDFKRRKDVVFKYRKEAERSNSFSSKLSKLNLHTIKKKYTRFNYKLTSTIGLGNRNKDTDFDFELNRFRSLEKSIKNFLKNLSLFIEQLEIYVKTTYNLTEEMITLYGDKSKQQRLIERSKICHHEILNKSINELKNKIDNYVIDVLKHLLEKFTNPEILIKKRKDKSIDLECANNKYQSSKDGPKSKLSKDEYQSYKEIYDALNQQLLQDLPMFTTFGTEIFTNCIIAFITFYKKFIGNIVKQMLELLSLPPISNSKITCSNDIIETFIVKHNLVAMKLVDDYHIVPNNIFPQVINSQTLASAALDKHKLMRNSKLLNSNKGIKTNNQTKENRLAILSNSKINPELIYLVKENYEPNDVCDLFAEKDDIVVVTVKKDPTGSLNRWFVDNGSEKGFLPAQILEPYKKNLTSFNYQQQNSNTPSAFYGSLNQQKQYSDWKTPISSPSSSNIYSEIGDPLLFSTNHITKTTTDLTLDDFDPIKQQQKTYENIITINNRDDNNEEDINLKRKEPPCNEYMVAAFDFFPIGERQLSLKAGDIVIVKYKSDLHNNNEWWYVENKDNKFGYVPFNYLSNH